MQVITRFPPSPTGYLHIGGVRTALFNWLYARKMGGELVLRIEDTDRQRFTQEAVDTILDGMKWLGLTWDNGPFYQTQRFDRYSEAISQLLEQGDAYHCFCSKERLDEIRVAQKANGEKMRYDGRCRDLNRTPGEDESSVIRFRNPQEGSVVFDDIIRGRVAVANIEMDDLIIQRTDGSPTYNLTVVVDDIDMNISHVIRGEDHINNTPRQINIFNALGSKLPKFAHVPLILGEDGQRLSKRHGAVSVLEYRNLGILPEALLNYLVRLGWSHGDQEIFTVDQMIELFEIENINKSPAAFNMEKLLWINQHYINQVDSPRLVKELAKRLNQRGVGLGNGPNIEEVIDVLRERVRTLEELADMAVYFYDEVDHYDPDAVKQHIRPETIDLLEKSASALSNIENWQVAEIKAVIKSLVKEEQVKFPQIAQPLRIAVSGASATPSIDITLKLIGKARTLERIANAVARLRKSA